VIDSSPPRGLLLSGDACFDRYGTVRAAIERQGKALASLDLLIATHALVVDSVLVTNDRAFWQVEGLQLEDWVA
jgi:tRNA(fMet)-specific endonuclease VapC